MALSESNREFLHKALKALTERTYFEAYAEDPRQYEKLESDTIDSLVNKYHELDRATKGTPLRSDEISPYTLEALGVTYNDLPIDDGVQNARNAASSWKNVEIEDRAEILINALERSKKNYHLMAQATMHTTGQSFVMAFQASGPHSTDRALEAVAVAYKVLNEYNSKATWTKEAVGVTLEKEFLAIPKGIALSIGCSTFPVWNSIPAIMANLMAGNPVIHKPHPQSILPIHLLLNDIRQEIIDFGADPNILQLAPDTISNPKGKLLAEHPDVKVIDYTGGSEFGNYLEGLKRKTVFTEKSGVNSILLESVSDLNAVVQNIAFSLSLYSGQMCTAPQNIFIPKSGIKVGDEHLTYDKVESALVEAINNIGNHEKIGPGTYACIQNERTMDRGQDFEQVKGTWLIKPDELENPKFPNARTQTFALKRVDSEDFEPKEWFGPMALVVRTESIQESIGLARKSALSHGAISCGAYSTDPGIQKLIANGMNEAFVQVSFNLQGYIWVNQASAFSDFHVTGGNPAGNATFTNYEFVSRRFIWVGNRYLVEQE